MRSATRNKVGKDKAYLAYIRSLPCLCCDPDEQNSPTEAAHVGERGLSQKCDDRETIPLCAKHHRLSKDSAHRAGKHFWKCWEIDKDTILRRLSSAYESVAA